MVRHFHPLVVVRNSKACVKNLLMFHDHSTEDQYPAGIMIRIYYSASGRISALTFRRYVPLSAALGIMVAFLFSFLLFGTVRPPFLPLMPNPDPVHQLFYTFLPFVFSAPLFIKRQHDRGRSPVFFALFSGLLVGFALFSTGGSLATHLPGQSELEAFVAKHVIHAPVTLMGLWLITDCWLFEGVPEVNEFGPSPLSGNHITQEQQVN